MNFSSSPVSAAAWRSVFSKNLGATPARDSWSLYFSTIPASWIAVRLFDACARFVSDGGWLWMGFTTVNDQFSVPFTWRAVALKGQSISRDPALGRFGPWDSLELRSLGTPPISHLNSIRADLVPLGGEERARTTAYPLSSVCSPSCWINVARSWAVKLGGGRRRGSAAAGGFMGPISMGDAAEPRSLSSSLSLYATRRLIEVMTMLLRYAKR